MKAYDIVGIGAGPANLSLAALSANIKTLKTIFIEKRSEFVWHPGMLLPDAKLQVPFLNDLVTLADPTSEYSFLNFLAKKKRLYQFIAANFNPMTRSEFNQYLKWIFNTLNNIQKSEEVLGVKFDGSKLIIQTSKTTYSTMNLVIGTGQVPFIPDSFKRHIDKNIFHNSLFMDQKPKYKNKRIAIIGGGQSGAEIFQNLLADDSQLPEKIYWISRRQNFLPLDDTSFTNEIFTPTYINYFHSLNDHYKTSFIKDQKLANQGISEWTAKEVYQKLYELRFVKERKEQFLLLPSHELITINKKGKEYDLIIQDLITRKTREVTVDAIILCTGYIYEIPKALSAIKEKFNYGEQGPYITKNYELDWEGMEECSIYIQNGAQHSHGVSDSTLSVAAYRSATIINHVTGKNIYPDLNDSSIINWGWGSKFKEDTIYDT